MNLTLQHDTFNIVSRKIYIKCLATLFHLYNASSNVVIKELPRENSVAAQYEHNGKDSPRMKSGKNDSFHDENVYFFKTQR